MPVLEECETATLDVIVPEQIAQEEDDAIERKFSREEDGRARRESRSQSALCEGSRES